MSGNPLWTDILQTITSSLTALFTLGSLLYLKHYTDTTDKTYEEAKRANQETLRPLLVLTDVKPVDGNRVATWKNTGGGLAVDVHTKEGVETTEADDNVLAPGYSIRFILPLMPDQDFIEIHYKSMSGAPLGTLAYFVPDGTTFNHYVTDSDEWKDQRLLELRTKMRAHAHKISSLKLFAQQKNRLTGVTPIT